MKEYKVSASIQIKLNALEEKLTRFSFTLDEQVNSLGAGKIASIIRLALKAFPAKYILVGNEVFFRLILYKFIIQDHQNGIQTFDGVTIFQSKYVAKDNFLLSS